MRIDEAKLKRILKERGLNKSALCESAGISSRTMAKIGKGESVGDKVIEKIAEFLGVQKSDLTFLGGALRVLQEEMRMKVPGGLYHETQIRLTYNSNHIEGSRLTEEQTRYIFETKTVGEMPFDVRVDDLIETNNHFRCIDFVIANATDKLSEELVLTMQRILKEGTEHADRYGAGHYKTQPNTVGGIETAKPDEVSARMKELLAWYSSIKKIGFEEIVEFHYRFESIHPFQDGNGRIGRLIAFKECLVHDIVPFYIDDANKWLYYRGLREWNEERGYLIETCRFGQDQYKALLDYFEIK